MPGKTTPPSEKHPLGTYEGRSVLSTDVIIRKTGDGLSESMKTDAKLISQGDRVFIVIEADCVDVHYPVEDRKYPTQGGVNRVHVLDAGTATFVDEDVVRSMLDEQAEKNARRKEQERGVLRLPDDQELRQQHNFGEHEAEPVDGCPLCAATDDE